jgi:hypothetical protein
MMEIPYDLLSKRMRSVAATGYFGGGSRGLLDQAYFARCRKIHHGTVLIFTRDIGHHACGWWKNPDYERCYHLSMSPAPRAIWTPDTPDLDATVRDAWIAAFFQEHVSKLWFEPPFSPEGKASNVNHWRLFCNDVWEPIVPRGEVYTKQFTEIGWKSWSEVQGARAEGERPE